jgi:hypothetical protein
MPEGDAVTIQAEAVRLREAGFASGVEIAGRLLWKHGDHPNRTFWHEEALATLPPEGDDE